MFHGSSHFKFPKSQLSSLTPRSFCLHATFPSTAVPRAQPPKCFHQQLWQSFERETCSHPDTKKRSALETEFRNGRLEALGWEWQVVLQSMHCCCCCCCFCCLLSSSSSSCCFLLLFLLFYREPSSPSWVQPIWLPGHICGETCFSHSQRVHSSFATTRSFRWKRQGYKASTVL